MDAHHNSDTLHNIGNRNKDSNRGRRTLTEENKKCECNNHSQAATKDVSPSYYEYSTLKQEKEKLICNEKADHLKDLNYVTRSKSAKKEQRARAVQRSKTIYLNLSKGKNDGAENRFSLQFLFQGLWKKKKSMKLQT